MFLQLRYISSLTFSQDSLATDQSQGQGTYRDISQDHSCHDPNQSQGHILNELEPTAFDAATRAQTKVLPTAVTLRPEDWVKAPEFVPGQMWQFRGKWK